MWSAYAIRCRIVKTIRRMPDMYILTAYVHKNT